MADGNEEIVSIGAFPFQIPLTVPLGSLRFITGRVGRCCLIFRNTVGHQHQRRLSLPVEVHKVDIVAILFGTPLGIQYSIFIEYIVGAYRLCKLAVEVPSVKGHGHRVVFPARRGQQRWPAAIHDHDGINGVQGIRILSRIKPKRHKLPPLGGIGYIGGDRSGHQLVITVYRLIVAGQPAHQGVTLTAPLGRAFLCGIPLVTHIFHHRIEAFRHKGHRILRCIPQIQGNGSVRPVFPLLILCAVGLRIGQIISRGSSIAPYGAYVIHRYRCFRTEVGTVINTQIIIKLIGSRFFCGAIDPECSQTCYRKRSDAVSVVIHRKRVNINGIGIAVFIDAV